MHINFKFGKRDQKKYSEVIRHLSEIDEGDLSRVCKEALLFYVNNLNNNNNEVLIKSPTYNNAVTTREEKESKNLKEKNITKKEAEVYNEIPVVMPTTEVKNSIDISNVDKFLDF